MGETLAVDAANFRLVSVIVRRSKPFAGDAAFGDRLEISFRWIDLDGGFFDELVPPIGFEKKLKGFFFGEEDRLFEFAAVEGRLFFGNFEMGAAAGALGEDNFCDIEERVNAGDVMDFFADKLDRGFVRNEGDVDAFCGSDFFTAGLGARATFFKATVATTSTTALATVIAAVALVAVCSSATIISSAGG